MSLFDCLDAEGAMLQQQQMAALAAYNQGLQNSLAMNMRPGGVIMLDDYDDSPEGRARRLERRRLEFHQAEVDRNTTLLIYRFKRTQLRGERMDERTARRRKAARERFYSRAAVGAACLVAIPLALAVVVLAWRVFFYVALQ